MSSANVQHYSVEQDGNRIDTFVTNDLSHAVSAWKMKRAELKENWKIIDHSVTVAMLQTSQLHPPVPVIMLVVVSELIEFPDATKMMETMIDGLGLTESEKEKLVGQIRESLKNDLSKP